jgi:hypothetical protein
MFINALARGLIGVLLAAVSLPALSQKPNLKKEQGKYVVELRIPPEGVFGGEEVDIEFRVGDKTKDDPIMGPAGVSNVEAKATVTMPSMPGMPVQKPKKACPAITASSASFPTAASTRSIWS